LGFSDRDGNLVNNCKVYERKAETFIQWDLGSGK
jgi:hypothetical protein